MRKHSALLLYVIFVVVNMINGILLGYKQLYTDGFSLLLVIVSLVMVVIAFEVTIVVHELGHLFFGLLTGYQFVSFRYRSFLWKKDNSGKLIMLRFSVKGTGGQCLLLPPDVDDAPVYLYNGGGVIFNVVFAILATSLVFLLPNGFQLSSFLLLLSFIGLTIAVTNWMDSKGLLNDGRNHRDMKARIESKEALLLILELNALMSNGILLSTLDIGEHDYSYYDTNVALEFNVVGVMSDKAFNLLDFEKGFFLLDILMRTPLYNPTDYILKLSYYLGLLMFDVDEAKGFYTAHRQDIEVARNFIKDTPTFEMLAMCEGVYLDGVYDEHLMEVMMVKIANHPLPGAAYDNEKQLELLADAVSKLSN